MVWALAMNHGWHVVPFSDWLTQRSITRPSEVMLHCETLLFITNTIVAEVESGSTCESYLATEDQNGFTKPTMLHGATPAET